jgi:biotin carboxylase
MRERLAHKCVSQPPFVVVRSADEALTAAEQLTFPVVLKPISLSASQGVIRIDNAAGIPASVDRVRRILAKRGRPSDEPLLLENFTPGKEVAVEGLLSNGVLTILAIFDKPDPLNGPFFEETLYVTPSRLPRSNQNAICSVTSDASMALGLTEGPIHAELRVQGNQAWILEIASRSIGGLCARSLRFGLGVSLEQLILRHAVRLPIRETARTDAASGVMMLPIPRSGRLISVEGVEQAREIQGVAGVEITVSPGRDLVPLPEGSQYLGFVFARGYKPADVESTLRQAHARIRFNVQDD